MRYPLVVFALLLALSLHAQSPYCGLLVEPTGNYTAAVNNTYASPVNAFGLTQPLQLDVYKPNGVSATDKRPLIVFIHGGAFVSGSRFEMTAACQEAAKRGYVAATVSYRLGWPGINPFNLCANDYSEFTKAALRATQDVRAAVQYLYGQANTFGIDTTVTILAGYSAGAITALNTAFVDQTEAYALEPAASSLGDFPTLTGVKAVVSLAGAMSNTQTMQNNTDLLLISAHGTCDDVVPYLSGQVFECNNYPIIYGDAYLQKTADTLGMHRSFFTVCNGSHYLIGFLSTMYDSIFTIINRRVHCGLPVESQWHAKTTPNCEATADLYVGCVSTQTADNKSLPPRVVPNPTSTYARVEHVPLGTTIQVVNQIGQNVAQFITRDPTCTLPLLEPGAYTILYTMPSGQCGSIAWLIAPY